jgi:hypothetical protein
LTGRAGRQGGRQVAYADRREDTQSPGADDIALLHFGAVVAIGRVPAFWIDSPWVIPGS